MAPIPPGPPVARRRLLDELTDRILAHIADEGLRPGDRLPSNRALSERFGVATPTLREALRRLEATGAIDIRHGSGVYVRADLSRMIMPNPNRLRLDRAAVLELLEARELIEPHLAEAAARNATDEQVAELADGPDFHRAVAQLAGNRALAQVLDSLTVLTAYRCQGHLCQEHQAILAAVRHRSPRRAGQLMRGHLRTVRAAILDTVRS